jgi:malate dehydrogenase (oxaloacetate-decarboxylating)
MRKVWRDEDGAWRTTLRGRHALANPRINKGTAFDDSERHDLGLTGLIPAAHFTLYDQVGRVYTQYRHQPDDLARNVTLNALQDPRRTRDPGQAGEPGITNHVSH